MINITINRNRNINYMLLFKLLSCILNTIEFIYQNEQNISKYNISNIQEPISSIITEILNRNTSYLELGAIGYMLTSIKAISKYDKNKRYPIRELFKYYRIKYFCNSLLLCSIPKDKIVYKGTGNSEIIIDNETVDKCIKWINNAHKELIIIQKTYADRLLEKNKSILSFVETEIDQLPKNSKYPIHREEELTKMKNECKEYEYYIDLMTKGIIESIALLQWKLHRCKSKQDQKLFILNTLKTKDTRAFLGYYKPIDTTDTTNTTAINTDTTATTTAINIDTNIDTNTNIDANTVEVSVDNNVINNKNILDGIREREEELKSSESIETDLNEDIDNDSDRILKQMALVNIKGYNDNILENYINQGIELRREHMLNNLSFNYTPRALIPQINEPEHFKQDYVYPLDPIERSNEVKEIEEVHINIDDDSNDNDNDNTNNANDNTNNTSNANGIASMDNPSIKRSIHNSTKNKEDHPTKEELEEDDYGILALLVEARELYKSLRRESDPNWESNEIYSYNDSSSDQMIFQAPHLSKEDLKAYYTPSNHSQELNRKFNSEESLALILRNKSQENPEEINTPFTVRDSYSPFDNDDNDCLYDSEAHYSLEQDKVRRLIEYNNNYIQRHSEDTNQFQSDQMDLEDENILNTQPTEQLETNKETEVFLDQEQVPHQTKETNQVPEEKDHSGPWENTEQTCNPSKIKSETTELPCVN
ncbi:hypothetical protein NEOKW01_1186 [Nematocida sp. AWRm80]|nr:hypothetical protein NEOKW01_1186 [Nematocida sp. AWRm80]